MISIKQLVLAFALIGSIVGGAWAFDARIDAKVTEHIAPISKNVEAIRGLLEALLLQMAENGG